MTGFRFRTCNSRRRLVNVTGNFQRPLQLLPVRATSQEATHRTTRTNQYRQSAVSLAGGGPSAARGRERKKHERFTTKHPGERRGCLCRRRRDRRRRSVGGLDSTDCTSLRRRHRFGRRRLHPQLQPVPGGLAGIQRLHRRRHLREPRHLHRLRRRTHLQRAGEEARRVERREDPDDHHPAERQVVGRLAPDGRRRGVQPQHRQAEQVRRSHRPDVAHAATSRRSRSPARTRLRFSSRHPTPPSSARSSRTSGSSRRRSGPRSTSRSSRTRIPSARDRSRR